VCMAGDVSVHVDPTATSQPHREDPHCFEWATAQSFPPAVRAVRGGMTSQTPSEVRPLAARVREIYRVSTSLPSPPSRQSRSMATRAGPLLQVACEGQVSATDRRASGSAARRICQSCIL
jgi:hypothetical protein